MDEGLVKITRENPASILRQCQVSITKGGRAILLSVKVDSSFALTFCGYRRNLHQDVRTGYRDTEVEAHG